MTLTQNKYIFLVYNFNRHLIAKTVTVRESLARLNDLGADAILIVTDEDGRLFGSLTDGDVRRGFINGLSFENIIADFVQRNPAFVKSGHYTQEELRHYNNLNLKIIPILNDDLIVVDVINLRLIKTILPVDMVIMAGGEGRRLRPLTEETPKPLLRVGDKAIIQHNIDRLRKFGISHFYITTKYLADQIVSHFESQKEISCVFLYEEIPLGTIGALANIDDFKHEYVMVMNSDIMTNIDYSNMFESLLESNGDMIVATTPYKVNIPYGVVETTGNQIVGLKEKPVYTYFSNAGIYIIKKTELMHIPKNKMFNATDLIEVLIQAQKKVINYPILGYWLDIGQHDDYQKAQTDILHIDIMA